MKIKNLFEEYVRDVKETPIFKNPTKKEIEEAALKNNPSRRVRFFMDDKNKVCYIFNAYTLTHKPVSDVIDRSLYNLETFGTGFSGTAMYDENKGILFAVNSDGIYQAIFNEYYKEVKKIIKNPRRWNKYINCDMMLFSMKKTLKTQMLRKGEEWDEN